MQISSNELTLHTGRKVLDEVIAAIQKGDSELDFKNVKRIDSSALAVLLSARRHSKNPDAIKILNRPVQLDALIEAYGVQTLFN